MGAFVSSKHTAEVAELLVIAALLAAYQTDVYAHKLEQLLCYGNSDTNML